MNPFDSWPSGKTGTADPFSSIQIRVSYDQQKTQNTLSSAAAVGLGGSW